MRRIPVVMLASLLLFPCLGRAQEPKILMPRPFQDGAGWFSINVPADWQDLCEVELGRRTYVFTPGPESDDVGKMGMSVSLIAGWRQRQVTEDVLNAAAALEIKRFTDEARQVGSTAVVRDRQGVILSRQSGLAVTIDETMQDKQQSVVKMFVMPSMIHTFVIQYRLPKEDEALSAVQFERLIRRFKILYPKLEAFDAEALTGFTDDAMHVTVKHPPSWKATADGEGDGRQITVASPTSRDEGAPCPAVTVSKVTNAASQFRGLTPEQMLEACAKRYVEAMRKTSGDVTLLPKSSRARIGREAALAYQLEYQAGDQSRYALLVVAMKKGTLVQVLLTAPAEEFSHYAPLFGRILITLQAF